MKIRKINKKAQEEMVGFVLIIVLVMVIFVVFLGFSLRNSQKESVEDYEVESFIQAFLQYTTSCEENYESNYLSIQELIFKCDAKEKCLNEDDSCVVLNNTLEKLLDESWKVGNDSQYKGYELKINAGEAEILFIDEGNVTNNYKSGVQDYSKRGKKFEIIFTAYY